MLTIEPFVRSCGLCGSMVKEKNGVVTPSQPKQGCCQTAITVDMILDRLIIDGKLDMYDKPTITEIRQAVEAVNGKD